MSRVIAVADYWWAQDLSCERADLRPSRPFVREYGGGLHGREGIFILALGAAPVISISPHVMGLVGDRASSWSARDVTEPETLRERLRPVCVRVEQIVGPSVLAYASPEMLDLEAADRARPLTASDLGAVDRCRRQCPEEDWARGGATTGSAKRFGAHDDDGNLAAIASYEVWGGDIAHVSVVTHPRRRGAGYGRAAAALAVRHAVEAGLLPQYRTLRSNAAAVRLGAQLGFVEYGVSVQVKLTPEATAA
jgi:GNAT superfamily N-acetyltransferase